MKLIALAAVPTSFALAGPAAAANFGFVRWPDYLDPFILAAAVASGVAIAWLKAVLPRGRSFVEVPKADRTPAMHLAALMTVVSVPALLGLIFVGMGLQRLAE